ncbi:MAG: 4-alpha-glucanotransferase [Chloroflexi bacterium]|nr:4-alpha-glucanotransferase [Chloroflexota bacterium]
MGMHSELSTLWELARLYGVQTAYYDQTGRRRQASWEAALAALRALGAPLTGLREAQEALRHERKALWQRTLEPVLLAWNGDLPEVQVRLPPSSADGPLFGHLRLETGEEHRWQWRAKDLPVLGQEGVEGLSYTLRALSLPLSLPFGYHRLTLEADGHPWEALIVSAPLKGHSLRDEAAWGLFVPPYALRSRRGWGSGSFSDLEALCAWEAQLGGQVVATLPLLDTFLEEPFEPNPYRPASRLMWSEFYVDVSRAPELSRSPRAQALIASAAFREGVDGLLASPVVDYRRLMALKRQVLEELCRCCFEGVGNRLEDLHQFARTHSAVEHYGAFRATLERQSTPWRSWPQRLRGGVLREGDYGEEARRYHVYVQWLAHQQLEGLSREAAAKGVRLYLDLPVGVHPDGFDVWREQDLFVQDVSVGAPPDNFFARGQDWGFPPMHPHRARDKGYDYFIACLRHHMRIAGVLRIDHVMGFHRLFWIPQGAGANQGVYVRYPAEEYYAILALESFRSKVDIVGEDLGTVSPEVRPAMAHHGVHRTYVAQFNFRPEPRDAVGPVPDGAVVSLNTHDTPTFAAFWQGLDIEYRQELGLLTPDEARREQEARGTLRDALLGFLRGDELTREVSQEPGEVLRALLAFLAGSRAPLLLVNLEDLWLETMPQNVPGVADGRDNWKRAMRCSLEELTQLPQVLTALQQVDQCRKGRTR